MNSLLTLRYCLSMFDVVATWKERLSLLVILRIKWTTKLRVWIGSLVFEQPFEDSGRKNKTLCVSHMEGQLIQTGNFVVRWNSSVDLPKHQVWIRSLRCRSLWTLLVLLGCLPGWWEAEECASVYSIVCPEVISRLLKVIYNQVWKHRFRRSDCSLLENLIKV